MGFCLRLPARLSDVDRSLIPECHMDLPGSFMTGQIRWAYAGIVTALIGGGLLWIALRVGQG